MVILQYLWGNLFLGNVLLKLSFEPQMLSVITMENYIGKLQYLWGNLFLGNVLLKLSFEPQMLSVITMENYIGKLQEFYQKGNLSLPIYLDKGKDDSELFEMQVQLPDGKVFNGRAKNKKDAKMNAAQQAWLHTATFKKNLRIAGKVYLAIDIENIGDYAQQLNQYNLVGELSIVGFYSESCVRTFEDGGIPKILITSSRKDASDIGMIMYITQLYLRDEYDQIIIWTKDHYGIVVKEILNGNFGGRTIVRVIKDLSELVEN